MTASYVATVVGPSLPDGRSIDAPLDVLISMEVLDPYSPQCPADLPCQVRSADLWFSDTPAELEQAKSLCAQCPVQTACLAGALQRREPWGVWGGEIFERGSVLARKRGRGRPRKIDAGDNMITAA